LWVKLEHGNGMTKWFFAGTVAFIAPHANMSSWCVAFRNDIDKIYEVASRRKNEYSWRVVDAKRIGLDVTPELGDKVWTNWEDAAKDAIQCETVWNLTQDLRFVITKHEPKPKEKHWYLKQPLPGGISVGTCGKLVPGTENRYDFGCYQMSRENFPQYNDIFMVAWPDWFELR